MISATGIKVSPDRLVSLAVDPDKLTIAGIDDDGSAFRAAVPRSSLIDLRIELRDAAAADAVEGFTNFTILGKAVGRSFSSLINKVTGHTPPQQTIITIASARAIVVMNNSEITPEDADALFAPVEVDVSANRKKIIEAHNAGAASEEHVITILGELAELHQSGVLTDQEFSRKKAQILARI